MGKADHIQIFFHVGTGKTGTTFLQYRVFPKMKGIHYIQRTKYKNVVQIIQNLDAEKILISREFDQQLEHEVEAFSTHFPNTRPIIVFRRHDSYIASQYRRFVKNGFSGNFTEFFDLKTNNGLFKHDDLNYSKQLEILEKYFTKAPLVFLYDDFRNAPKDFIERFAAAIGASIDFDSINFSRKHTSYNEKQLTVIRSISSKLNLRKRRVFKNGLLHLFWRLGMSIIRYGILYGALLIPKKFVETTPLISDSCLHEIKDFYTDDWEACKRKASSNQKTPS